MRLHHLEITAFGPFAGTVSVDLDQLSAAGLFLLSGPTGAGKTSVLDAICFALYGDVPGERATARRLRCDQAAPGVAPRVVLEATLAGRPFRIIRSPAWERPKKRGTGSTTQQASVVVAERRSGEWATLTTRLDEAGHLISGLLGMTLTQFVQVAMLPQGRFQAFLRARAEERKELLQRLFRTERFADVERWLREHRLELRRCSEEVHQRVADVVSRTSEAAASPLPVGWDVTDLSLPAGDGELTSWVDALVEDARAAQEIATGRAGETRTAETVARTMLETARALTTRRARVDAAAAEHADLVAATEEHELAVAALEAAGRAAPVIPLYRLAERVRHARDAAAATAPADDTDETARTRLTDLTEKLAHVRTLLPRADRLARVNAKLAGARERRRTLTAELEETGARAAALPVRLRELRAAVEESKRAAERVESLRERISAYVVASDLTVDLTEARALHLGAREAAADAREAVITLHEARVASMAAELAGSLAVGADCPVCGSVDHPHKAVAVPGAPDAAAEKAAQRAADDAAAEELARAERVRELTTRLELALGRAGAPEERPIIEKELARLGQVAEALPSHERGVATAEAEADRLGERSMTLTAQVAELEASLRHLGEEGDQLASLLNGALEGTGTEHPATLVEILEADVRAASTAVRQIEAAARAEDALAAATADLAACCAEHGFVNPEEALAAALDPEVVEELTATVKHHERRLAHVTAVLAEPGTDEVAAAVLPDLAELEAVHVDALAAFTEAQGAVAARVAALARLTALQRELGDLLDAWGPLRRQLELATRLASFAEGKSADNRLQMSLSAYVVAYRLTQVVAAANERLTAMSDQRYQLEHTAGRGAGDRRGGLTLLVRDDWSGETRDPATLSGGETFVVSLALALGLADVITQEAGGAVLDTLFVDEGFGSLDADTLDDVMDVLDGLRDGGRVVGIVSHVAELRDRVPTQLVVTKSRSGSTLAIR